MIKTPRTPDLCKILIACVGTVVLVGSVSGQRKSDRETSDYRGPVSVVTTRSVKYKIVDGKLTKTKNQLRSIERFDRRGNLLRKIEWDDNGIVKWDERNIFRRGKVVGWKVSSGPKDPFDSFFYRFDRKGNIVEENSYDKAGELDSQTKYKYDKTNREIERVLGTESDEEQIVTRNVYHGRGRVREVSRFLKTPKGLVPHEDAGYYRRVLYYGKDQRWYAAESYSADDKLFGVTKMRRDVFGNETADNEFGADGSVKYKVRDKYSYDRRGNWIVDRQRAMRRATNPEKYEIEEITFRKVQYFK